MFFYSDIVYSLILELFLCKRHIFTIFKALATEKSSASDELNSSSVAALLEALILTEIDQVRRRPEITDNMFLHVIN
jgi:hypothetical protein